MLPRHAHNDEAAHHEAAHHEAAHHEAAHDTTARVERYWMRFFAPLRMTAA
jgi:hypothetical protein